MSNFDSIIVEFSVHVNELHSWDNVFVVGSHEKIGSWNPEYALELFPDENLNLWKNKITITPEEAKKPFHYRYFIGYYLQDSADPNSKKKVVAKWEAQFLPRTLLPGVRAYKKTGIDEFGFYNGKTKLSNGWLHHSNLCEALLRFHGHALKFFKQRYNEKTYFIKVVPFDLRYKEEIRYTSERGHFLWRMSSVYKNSIGSIDDDGDDSCDTPYSLPQLPSFSHMEVTDLSNGDQHYRDQCIHGEKFKNGTKYIIYRTKTVAAEYLAFRFEFYVDSKLKTTTESNSIHVNGKCQINDVRTSNEQQTEMQRIAIAYCMPTSMSDTFGTFSIPILAKNQQPIGLLSVDYLTVKATTPMIEQSMEVSFSKHWKKRVPLEIGHRGSGNSYTKFAAARENTIHSLNRAAQKGADFVELDVQLTKDKYAVIFHDFHVLVSVARRSGSVMDLQKITTENGDIGITDYHELAVKDLKLHQLKLLHLHHHKAQEHSDKLKVTTTTEEDEELEPFPSLVDALKNVNEDVGFNIEVKYPLATKDGKHECENYFERNEFIDIILKDVYKYAKNRRIVFSSFDPDMCTLIALKQHKYPVLFLSVGETQRYVPFVDERTCTSSMAVNFAISQDILGINLHSEDILRDSSQVIKAKEMGLVAFVWGDDLDDRENVKKMKELGLDGIIYDRIGELEARQNIFIVERDARKTLFSASPGPSRSGSLDKNIQNSLNSLDIAVPTLMNGNDTSSSSSSTTNTPRPRSPLSPKKSGRFNEV